MTVTIDLNADMGEFADDAQRDIEAALMAIVTSCSIACGGHAGDEASMSETVRRAKAHGVSIGAHPSYPDRDGFGRRSLDFPEEPLRRAVQTQIAAVKKIADAEDWPLTHIKAHGALYNDAAKDERLSALIVEAGEGLIVVGPPGSALERAARAAGAPFAAEGFVDRLYCKDGALTARSEKGAVIADIDARAEQALAIAKGEEIKACDGVLRLSVKTLCIHSDAPGAVETAMAVRAALEADNIAIQSFA